MQMSLSRVSLPETDGQREREREKQTRLVLDRGKRSCRRFADAAA